MKAHTFLSNFIFAAATLLCFAFPSPSTARRCLRCSYHDEECNADDYQDVQFDAPVSFSLTTHIPLNSTFSFSTGLACSFLSNAFRHSHCGNTEGATRLYYLGIPASISGNLFHSGRWTAYLSLGVTVEKGLLKIRRFTSRCGDHTSFSITKTPVHGLEWSLLATLGLSYRILGNWHCFAEQKLNYYFNTGQPLSAHTNDPFPHTLGFGFRYCF
ncbi:MAG: hypothetical protein LBU08_02630 [Tannerellaceae bacterium]|jgi:hypothetical protein|nr:hypothetical protein [Tannerellaceae bacterium]